MNFYWHDHTASGSEPNLIGLDKFVQLFSAMETNSPNDFTRAPSPKLGFIHTDRTELWRVAAQDNAWIVFVSSVALEQYNTPYVHYLKKTCQYVAEYLTPEIAKAFSESCKNGAPDFELFYPRPIDNLIALYLLELANQDTDAIMAMKRSVCDEAKKEYSEITGKTLQLPDDAAQRREALRTILTSLTTE